MPEARFSRSAQADLLNIASYTLKTWGAAQAERYLGALEQCARLLAANPALGRKCNWIRPGLYRFEIEQHVLFYRPAEGGILVSRILHRSMLPEDKAFEDPAPEN